MANGVGALLQLLGKVDANNALVVTGDAGGTVSGGVQAVAQLQGKVDASNQLVVKFV